MKRLQRASLICVFSGLMLLVAGIARVPSASAQGSAGGRDLKAVVPTMPVGSSPLYPKSAGSGVSPDYTSHIVERCNSDGAYCIYLAGIAGTRYIYWIDVFDATGIDGGETGWAETDMGVYYNGESTGTYPVTNPPYIGICEPWNANAAGGTYSGYIAWFSPEPQPDVDVTGSLASGSIPPAPANPIPHVGDCT